MTVTRQMMRETGANEDDLEGLPAIPRQIEGVAVGLTLRETETGSIKFPFGRRNPLTRRIFAA